MGLPAVAIAATVLSTAVSAYGAIQQGNAAQDAANYQAQVAKNNQVIADQNATYARQAGAAQEAAQRMKTASLEGKQRAAAAANGFDVNTGSNADLGASAAALGELDALTIRNNAARSAYGYTTQGQSFGAQAGLLESQGQNAATAGVVGGFSSLVGGASSVADKWSKYNTAGVAVI